MENFKMKKYKVKKLFPQTTTCYKIGDVIDSNSDKRILEMAPRWPEFFEEIPEFELQVENGKVITDPEQYVSIVRISDCWYAGRTTAKFWKDWNSLLYKAFATESEKNAYIKLYSKRFSQDDINKLCDELNRDNSWMTEHPMIYLSALRDIKSKLNAL